MAMLNNQMVISYIAMENGPLCSLIYLSKTVMFNMIVYQRVTPKCCKCIFGKLSHHPLLGMLCIISFSRVPKKKQALGHLGV